MNRTQARSAPTRAIMRARMRKRATRLPAPARPSRAPALVPRQLRRGVIGLGDGFSAIADLSALALASVRSGQWAGRFALRLGRRQFQLDVRRLLLVLDVVKRDQAKLEG